jgi:hypothetical protein
MDLTPPPVRAASSSITPPETIEALAPPPVRGGGVLTPQNGIPGTNPPLALPPATVEKGPPETAWSPQPLSDSGKIEAIYLSKAAMRDIGSRRDLYERVLWTRRLSRCWVRIGKFMQKPKRKLTKPAEEAELARLLTEIDEVEILGQPGHAGYRLMALAAQEQVAARFKAMDELDREALSRDWEAGKVVLAEYKEFLKRKVVGHRRLSPLQRVGALADTFVGANWLWVIFGFGVVALLLLAVVWIH